MADSKFQEVIVGEDEPTSLSLPPVLHRGLAAVAAFGILSFFTSLSLFCFLSYKLVSWHINGDRDHILPRPAYSSPEQESPRPLSVSGFLIPDTHLCPQRQDTWPLFAREKESFWQRIKREPPNQFLILIYNLLLSDIQQAAAFSLNVAWLVRNEIDVESPMCWVQGFTLSTGDLGNSVFLTAIAVHTYLGVVKGYRLPTSAFYAGIVACWVFTYGVSLLPVVVTRNGRDVGGSVYVRAGAWCWIHNEYQDMRLYSHYLWIFISLASTIVIYVIICKRVQKQQQSTKDTPSQQCTNSGGNDKSRTSSPNGNAHYPNPIPKTRGPPEGTEPLPASIVMGTANSSSTTLTPGGGGRGPLTFPPSNRISSRVDQRLPSSPFPPSSPPPLTPISPSTASKTPEQEALPPPSSLPTITSFLLYPIIYLTCTIPLAAGRIASMAGNSVPLSYFCFAGALIACNGWMDCILYASTRRHILFSGKSPPSQEVGLATFAFMRTPPGRRFGNVVFVSGGGLHEESDGDSGDAERAKLGSLRGGNTGTRGKKGKGATENTSCEAVLKGHGMGKGEVMGLAIQMETTTTVVVEVEGVGVVEVEEEKKVKQHLEESGVGVLVFDLQFFMLLHAHFESSRFLWIDVNRPGESDEENPVFKTFLGIIGATVTTSATDLGDLSNIPRTSLDF
ncbi:hypothetical protein MKZ38_007894 [Zalerion maritima]|uniref:Glucose receptor Git3 N-terminal domain-containing protein n=1 Tax=Zalerion maritima TaxID=339359 RepID=A0AAD5RID1_9PEZI|nr:hypothetical protein MKZ38_007894 [Zalerion maritima]